MNTRNIEDMYPLAPVQEGILFHSLLEVGSGVYHTQFTCLLQGLQIAAFEQAWQRVVDRHPVLRTAFVWKTVDKPMQIVGRHIKLSITQEDCRGLAAAVQEEKFKRYVQEDRERGFDVAKAPLMRFALLQVADETYRFVWSHHHLLLDGWASATVLKEVFVVYDALRRGQELSLAPPRPYRDYIAWLRQQDMAKAEVYWRTALEGFTTPTPFGVERQPSVPQEQAGGYGKESCQLSATTTARLQEIARGQQLTLNTLVQGAWALLLSRYTGQSEVVFGSVVSGRPAALSGVEEMVGLFINTLPVRVKVDDKQRLAEWLRRLQSRQAEMREYEYSPLVEVQRWSDLDPRTPLFESYVVFENYPIDEDLKDKIDGLAISDVQSLERSSYPLVVAVTPGRQLTLQMFFELDRFAEPAIERMLAHLATLLQGIAANPEQRLADLSLLTSAERQQLLVEWNATEASYLTEVCIHQLFESQVARTPDSQALVFQDERLTYAELNARANQLAHRLRALGVRPEVRVGLCVERSAEMIVGLLAILKADGVYVPLDPQHPRQRLQYMIADAGVAVLVTQSHLSDALPADHLAKVVSLDRDAKALLRESKENLHPEVTGDNLAYVIYTSGSTGMPKGVGVSHEVAANHFLAIQKAFKLDASDRVLQFASLSFDVSLEQILPTFLIGARLVLRGDDVWTAAEFAGTLREERLTVINFPTAYWHRLAQEGGAGGKFDSRHDLKLAIAGGDMILPEAVRLWQNEPLGEARLLNAYGPTEAVITSTFFDIPVGFCDDPSAPRVPIGRAVAHRSLYILDERSQLVPVGVSGELHIGGPLLARGYLNHPGLTAEKFIPDPFALHAGARMYRTGDLARRLPDGNIEFLGRIDQQVKIRGYRVEPGEVEAALGSHASVREVTVLAQAATDGEKQLVAYVVSRNGDQPTTGEWRSYLKERLPEYMVPSAFVMLDELPLTPNGKVDRQALAAFKQTSQVSENEHIAPRDGIEADIAVVWAEVLGVERVGLQDDFFELGGHSLMATQVVSRLRERLKVAVPFRSLFDQPTVQGMAAIIAEARDAKQQEEEPRAAPAPIKSVARHLSLPLSFAQQRLWFLDQLEPDSSLYNIAAAVRLNGLLNISALTSAFNEITRRHESLRTTFIVSEGEPQQVISPDLTVLLPVMDLSALPAQEREAEATLRARKEAQRPFDLSTGPLLRASLLRVSAEEHILLLTMHHIISDGWSMGVLVKEVASLYEAFAAGRPSPLPELSIQYADYAVWQREWLHGEVWEKQIEYWKGQLADAETLELATDRARPPVQTYAGAKYYFELSEEASESVKTLSQREGVTLFTTLLAAFQTLLHRYTGQEDICVGTPSAGRTTSEIESLIGFFVNTLVVRTTISGRASFREVLARVRKSMLEAQTHQDLPFDRLVEALELERDMSRTPLFQVMFGLQNALLQTVQLPNLKISPMKADKTTAKVDLTLQIEETAAGLKGSFEYNTDLFDVATIERMAGHFRQLLEGIINNPGGRVSQLPLLTGPELYQLLDEWNETASEYPRDKCVHQLFEQQAERTPNAVAVIYEARQLTYGELNERANQLAHYLQSLGVGPDSLVGIMVERSIEMVVGLLGILKSGGAYVPLDPAYPHERLAFMLADADVHVLLTEQRLVGQLPEFAARVVRLDADWPEISRHGAKNVATTVQSENLAYVIYTSGSTGRPKGVMITHQAINRLVLNTDYVTLDSTDRIAQASNASFDAATFEIWGALLNGAQLVGVTKDVALSPREFAAQLEQQKISVLFLTTDLFNLLVSEMPQAFGSVRNLLFGGSAVDPRWVREALKHGAPERLLHVYGPTETTTYASWCLVQEVGPKATTIPIGKPIANTEIYVLDRDLNPSPVGVPGELYVGGDCLARGYLGRPELTAGRFVPHPFGGRAGARLYQTGDLVRRLTDGNIEFLGRTDHQVKLRGFRIEPGEIEATLRQHPDVREAIVMVSEETVGDRRLGAYVTAEEGAVLTTADLRRYMKVRLPEYMAPQVFVMMEDFPLSPNGKIDRRALPPLSAAQFEQGETYVAPQTETEKTLAEIWRNVLGIEPIGVHDDFFELGGHSLQATRVVSHLRDAFQVELPLRSFFEAPTVTGLAAAIEELRLADGESCLPRIGRCSREGDLPLSFGQERLWFLDQLQPLNPFYNVPVGMSLKGRLDTLTMQRTLNEIIRRHEVLRTSFAAADGEPQQVITPELTLPLPVIDLSALAAQEREAEASLLARDEAQRPFDLSTGPLLRASLLRVSAEEHILLLTMHHIISDGWSMGVLVKEVASLYEAFAAGRPSPLPELSIQYADYAVWQREWLQGEVWEKQIEYWKRQLADAETLQLPTDRQRPATQTYRGARYALELSEEVSKGLKALSQREGATIFMSLLAAFQSLLHHYTAQHDISVGTDIANRKWVEIESLIGFFINQLVLRTDLSGDPAFDELLRRVRDVTLEAYAHQDLPFDRLVDALKVERSLQSSPLFQVKFVLQNNPIPQFELPDLTVNLLNVRGDTSKFDLTLTLWEEAERIKGWFEFNSDLFEAATIARLSHNYATLLRTVVARPGINLGDLKAILAAGDREQQARQDMESKDAFSQKFKNARRKAVTVLPVGV